MTSIRKVQTLAGRNLDSRDFSTVRIREHSASCRPIHRYPRGKISLWRALRFYELSILPLTLGDDAIWGRERAATVVLTVIKVADVT